MTFPIEKALADIHQQSKDVQTKQTLYSLVQKDQYVGDVYSINYETANVLIHEFYRQQVGGIPSLSFLIATRITPDEEPLDYKTEDCSVLLLRVMDAAILPQDKEAERNGATS